tara:strand:- start:728 stop:865 length:138 start_codon:yes stop_codon:yes gene_type:complete
MKQPIATVNGIDIFKVDNYFMLKKGWATIGTYYTLKEAKLKAKNN